jgi:hypothetical protein
MGVSLAQRLSERLASASGPRGTGLALPALFGPPSIKSIIGPPLPAAEVVAALGPPPQVSALNFCKRVVM